MPVLTNEEIIQEYLDLVDKTWPSVAVAVAETSLTTIQLQPRVAALEANVGQLQGEIISGLPALIDAGTF
jgi:hypothetical protein